MLSLLLLFNIMRRASLVLLCNLKKIFRLQDNKQENSSRNGNDNTKIFMVHEN